MQSTRVWSVVGQVFRCVANYYFMHVFVYSCIFSLTLTLTFCLQLHLVIQVQTEIRVREAFVKCYLLDKLISFFFEVRVAAFRLAQRFLLATFFRLWRII